MTSSDVCTIKTERKQAGGLALGGMWNQHYPCELGKNQRREEGRKDIPGGENGKCCSS